MKARIVLTVRAKRDLASIKRYAVQRNRQAAERIRLQIRNSIKRLAAFPESGHATTDPTIRLLTVTRYQYLVFYEVRRDSVVIHHIRDARREPIDPRESKSI